MNGSEDEIAEPAASEARLMAAEIERLRARVTELEAIHTMLVGSLSAAAVGELDQPATITHGHTPNAPPHDE